jgi:hypothetical protein
VVRHDESGSRRAVPCKQLGETVELLPARGTDEPGAIDPEVVGGLAGDRGEFYGGDEDDRRPVRVRFVWTRLSLDAARGEQALSDSGPWETNRVTELTRVTPRKA